MIGFEDIVFHIERGDLLEHPNPDRYAGQRISVVRRDDYVFLAPFVEDEHTVFLKTIIPSRRATKPWFTPAVLAVIAGFADLEGVRSERVQPG